MSDKKILFLSPYPFGCAPSQRLKYEQYYPYFEKEGYAISTSSFVCPSFWKIIYKQGNILKKIWHTKIGYLRRIKDLFRIRQFDLVYIHLWVTPIGVPFFEWVVCTLAKKVIYDIDDLVFLNDKRKTNHIMSLIRGRKKAIFLMKKAGHVIVCTSKLEEYTRIYNDQVTDISSTINTISYQPVNLYKNDHKLVIGWSGSHSTSRYLHILDEVFRKLSLTFDFKLKVIGDPSFQIEGINLEAKEWSEATEIKELGEIDIGVYPLPLDEEWVLGKSGLKALQYMALGIPTIATAIGANFRIIENGVNGFLVKSAYEWEQHLSVLLNDQSLRKNLGNKGRQTVETQYSLIATAPTYLSIIHSVLSKK